MNIKALKAFDLIVTRGSLAAAAKALKLSQPSVSRLIALLESDTKLPLFHRTRRSLTLTSEGQAFHREIKHIVAGLDEIPRIASDLRDHGQQFKLIVTHKIAQGLISPALARLRRMNPKLRCVVDVESRSRFESLVGVKQFDLAIGTLPVAVPDRSIGIRPLVRSQVGVLLPEEHELARSPTVSVAELKGQPMIGLWPDQQWRQQVDEFLIAGGVAGDFVVQTRHVLMGCQLVRDGAGITLVDAVSARGIDSRGLLLRPLMPARHLTFGAIHPKESALSENAYMFLDCIRVGVEDMMRSNASDAPSIELICTDEECEGEVS